MLARQPGWGVLPSGPLLSPETPRAEEHFKATQLWKRGSPPQPHLKVSTCSPGVNLETLTGG